MDISLSQQDQVLVNESVIDKSLLVVVASYLDESDLFKFIEAIRIDINDKSFWNLLLLFIFPSIKNILINPPGNLKNYYKILLYYGRVSPSLNIMNNQNYYLDVVNHHNTLRELYLLYSILSFSVATEKDPRRIRIFDKEWYVLRCRYGYQLHFFNPQQFRFVISINQENKYVYS